MDGGINMKKRTVSINETKKNWLNTVPFSFLSPYPTMIFSPLKKNVSVVTGMMIWK